jgi:hypothetical protein
MPGSKNGNGFAKNLLIGAAALLIVGIAGSLYMGSRAAAAQQQTAVDEARTIADRSLGLVFRPDDLLSPASQARASDLTDRVGAVVIDPSNFDGVTLWSQDGEILYSTDQGLIGNTLDGQRDRIKQALDGKAQTQISDGTLSIMLPFKLRSGVGGPTAVELTTSAAGIVAAPGPWRTNALFLAVLLAVVGFALFRMARPAGHGAAQPIAARRGPAQPAPLAAARPITVPTPGLHEEADARRKAEDRARAAEERLSVLHDQYRSTLDELQLSQRRLQEATSENRADPRLKEQLEHTEHRAREFELRTRELEARLRTLEAEHEELARVTADPQVLQEVRDRLARAVTESDALRRERDALAAERAELATQRDDLMEQLATGVEPTQDPDLVARVRQAETEVIGLRAELEGAQTQLSMARRDLETTRATADRSIALQARAKELQEDLDAAHIESLHAREAHDAASAELGSARAELDDARTELRILRNEEQRAAMLEDELRAAKAELESAAASHRADLIEREAELEQKVRATREEFQGQVESITTQHRDELAARDAEVERRVAAAEAAAAEQIQRLRTELDERDARYGSAEQTVAEARAEAQRLAEELGAAKGEAEEARDRLEEATQRVAALTTRAEQAETLAEVSAERAERLASDFEVAAQDNADLNRRLQEVEARRRLELADAEGRADLDDLLRVTQERLAGQTEKLIAAEDRAHALEREMARKMERIEEVEAELRQHQMSDAMRAIRGEGHEVLAGEGVVGSGRLPLEDRRATTPFMKELSLDAKRSLMQILGLTQILKHKKDAKDQAQLVRQLTTYARRLDHVVADMADAETLVHGTIELNVRRTDLEALIQRVVEESGVDTDHEVRIDTERVTVAVDPLRTEQIVAGLLRASAARTAPRKAITVRLRSEEGGALLSVEDGEPSSDASMSPVVARFAEAQGGWTRVEGREDGGSAFKVFLPDGVKAPAGSGNEEPAAEPATDAEDDLHIVVDGSAEDPNPWGATPEQMLVQELHRLSEITAED